MAAVPRGGAGPRVGVASSGVGGACQARPHGGPSSPWQVLAGGSVPGPQVLLLQGGAHQPARGGAAVPHGRQHQAHLHPHRELPVPGHQLRAPARPEPCPPPGPPLQPPRPTGKPGVSCLSGGPPPLAPADPLSSPSSGTAASLEIFIFQVFLQAGSLLSKINGQIWHKAGVSLGAGGGVSAERGTFELWNKGCARHLWAPQDRAVSTCKPLLMPEQS